MSHADQYYYGTIPQNLTWIKLAAIMASGLAKYRREFQTKTGMDLEWDALEIVLQGWFDRDCASTLQDTIQDIDVERQFLPKVCVFFHRRIK